MSSGDNYEYEKSNTPQNRDSYSPFVEKQNSSYVNDLNNSVYQNTSLSLVQFDLGAIFNSNTVCDPNSMYLVLPITMCAACSSGSGIITSASPGASALCSMKTNYIHLIHSADIQLGNKTLESNQPYLNIVKHFKMISEMNLNDLATIGPTLGINKLDDVRSVRYISSNAATTAASGNGVVNNRPFGNGDHQGLHRASQNANAANTAILGKLNRFVDTSANVNNFTSLVTATQLGNEFRPYYEFKSGYHYWYDFCVVRLSDIFESMGNLGLIQRMDASLRIYVNTGAVNIAVGGTINTGNSQSYLLASGQSTFTNTCPLMVNYIADEITGGTINVATLPTGTTNIVASLCISKPGTTSFAGVNLASGTGAHPLLNCRIYYSQITMKTDLLLDYINNNKAKKVCYRTFITSFAPNISSGGTYSSIISAGITHPTSVLIVPYVASNTTSGLMNYAWTSPFDSAPATGHPISITNLQVNVGGKNQLATTLSYGYDTFLSQINNAEQLVTASDFGLSNGLFSQQWWESSKYYYVDCERSFSVDKLIPKNINVSFTNNSNVALDVLIFVQYSDEFTVDVSTGAITK